MYINQIIAAFVFMAIWCAVGTAYFLDHMDLPERPSRWAVLSFISGPLVWFGWLIYGIIWSLEGLGNKMPKNLKIAKKFKKWLTS